MKGKKSKGKGERICSKGEREIHGRERKKGKRSKGRRKDVIEITKGNKWKRE